MLTIKQGIYILSPDDLDLAKIQNTADVVSSVCRCAVQYEADTHALKITAQKNELVQSSLDLIRSKLQSTLYRNGDQLFLLGNPLEAVQLKDVEVFLVDARSRLAAPKAVGLSSDASPTQINEKIPLISPRPSLHDPMSSSRQDEFNSIALRAHILRTMRQLMHRQALMQMRLTFGALIFHKYQWPIQSEKQPIEKFMQSLRLLGTSASLYML